MIALADTYLAFILFVPWFAILGGLYMLFPQQPRGWKRRLYELSTLTASVIATLASIQWAYASASLSHGAMWRQLLASSVGYGVFLLCLLMALWLRQIVLRRGAFG